ncbi:TPA: hypothetical protein ACJT8R_003116 [Legionella pneumophila]|uniref:hypothetical protein n=1 Tax=Legionella pneumophila TaxID=446 RepID=UPI000483230D|nr:hypothetical protein [Legionella pneumophila]BCL64509.1 hypothetical protein [Legionella pneumophila serogroup 11]HAT1942970.1 UDP-N-acetyl glucosamine 2-epimerase [Legionella pneumophila]HAT8690673.1 hypothetical protein [Legionella pneumophila]HAT8728061.1 hypothetical protein [Legionella pneumophila]HAT9526013.1 hypothetical protein [Legionella pneumophila subsp. pneumophila]
MDLTSYVLLFNSPNRIGDGFDITKFPGVPVKCGFGVSQKLNNSNITSIFDCVEDAYFAYRCRDEVYKLLSQIAKARFGQNSFYDLFRIDGHSYGQYILGLCWGDLEHVFRVILALDAWLQKNSPTRVYLCGIDENNQLLLSLVMELLAHYKVNEIKTINIQELSKAIEPDKLQSYDFVGSYGFMNKLGIEEASIRSGKNIGMPRDLSYDNFCTTIANTPENEPLFIKVDKSTDSIYFEGSLIGVYAPKNRIYITLFSNKKQTKIILDKRGIVDAYSNKVISPHSPLYCSLTIWIKENKAGFILNQNKAHSLTIKDTQHPNGVEIGFNENDYAQMRWSKLVVLSNLDNEFLNSKLNNFLVKNRKRDSFLKQILNSADGLRKFFSKRVAIITPQMHHKSYIDTQGNFSIAPMYFEGFQDFLNTQDFFVVPIILGTPWLLDGKKIISNNCEYLFDQDLSSVEQSKILDVKSLFDESANKISHELLNQLSYELVNANILSILIDYISYLAKDLYNYYEFKLRMDNILQRCPVDYIIGPRLDSAFKWSVFSGKDFGIKSISLEISFLAHNFHRQHLLAGEQESSDAICLWGAHARDFLNELGLGHDNHFVTGLLSLDFYHAFSSKYQELKEERLKLWNYLGVTVEESPVILFTGTLGTKYKNFMDVDIYIESLVSLVSIVEDMNKGYIIVKPVTNCDDPDMLLSCLEKINSKRLLILDPDHPYQNLFYLLASDLVVTPPTTLIAEAIAVGVPCINVLYPGTYQWLPHSKEIAGLYNYLAPTARNRYELRKHVLDALKKSLHDDFDEEAMRSLFGQIDSKISQRLLDVINAI